MCAGRGRTHSRGWGCGGRCVGGIPPSLWLHSAQVRMCIVPCEGVSLYISVRIHAYIFPRHIRRHHIVINSPPRSAIDQCACLRGEGLMGRIELSSFSSQEVCQVICWLQCEFTSCRQQPNEGAKLLGGLLAPWWDAKWKAGATHAVCYHSICLKLQTGHYPAIILVDLQSQWMRQSLWLVQSPGGKIGTSL